MSIKRKSSLPSSGSSSLYYSVVNLIHVSLTLQSIAPTLRPMYSMEEIFKLCDSKLACTLHDMIFPEIALLKKHLVSQFLLTSMNLTHSQIRWCFFLFLYKRSHLVFIRDLDIFGKFFLIGWSRCDSRYLCTFAFLFPSFSWAGRITPCTLLFALFLRLYVFLLLLWIIMRPHTRTRLRYFRLPSFCSFPFQS